MTVDKKLKGLTEQISNLTKGLPNISDYVIYAPVIRSLLESCETIAQKIGRDKIDM